MKKIETSPKSEKSKIPNALTILRMTLAPFIAITVLSDIVCIENRYLVSLIAFWAIFSTDILDGLIARKKNPITEENSVTPFGEFADPVADKIVVLTCLVPFAYLHTISPYVVILLIGRDMIITGFRLIAIEQKILIPASHLGKVKTVLEVIMISFIFINMHMSLNSCIKYDIIINIIKYTIIGGTVFVALLSLITCICKHSDVLHSNKNN